MTLFRPGHFTLPARPVLKSAAARIRSKDVLKSFLLDQIVRVQNKPAPAEPSGRVKVLSLFFKSHPNRRKNLVHLDVLEAVLLLAFVDDLQMRLKVSGAKCARRQRRGPLRQMRRVARSKFTVKRFEVPEITPPFLLTPFPVYLLCTYYTNSSTRSSDFFMRSNVTVISYRIPYWLTTKHTLGKKL